LKHLNHIAGGNPEDASQMLQFAQQDVVC